MERTFSGRLRLPLPDGWIGKEQVTLLEPQGKANVIASGEPIRPDMDARAYADAQGDQLHQDFAGYQEISYRPEFVFGDRPGFLRVFTWTPDEGPPVTQMQVYYAADGWGWTATATTPSHSFEHFRPVLEQVLGASSLDPAAL